MFMIRYSSVHPRSTRADCGGNHAHIRTCTCPYRLTSFPILILIALYERQAQRTGALTFYETVSAAAEKVIDTLPRGLKRLCEFLLMLGSVGQGKTAGINVGAFHTQRCSKG